MAERLRRHHRLLSAAGRACLAADAAGVGMVGHEGHHCDLPGPLDGRPKAALVLGAHTGAATGLNLGPLRYEPSNLVDILIIDVRNVLYAEGADLAPPHKAATGASTRSSVSA